MRRSLIRGWGDFGARPADRWLEYNERYFDGPAHPAADVLYATSLDDPFEFDTAA
jgi:hypothetical protein